MTIKIQHQPNANVVAPVAYQAGQGMFQQKQAARVDDRNRLQLQADMQQQAQQANIAMDMARMEAQRQAQERSLFANLWFDNNRNQQQLQQQAAERDFTREKMVNDYAFRDDASAQAFERQKQLEKMQFDERQSMQDSAWQQGSVGVTEKQVQSITAEMAKQQQNLTPEGQRLYGDLAGKLRAVEQQRAQVRPAQYNALLSQWQAEFEQSGVRNHIQEPPTVEESWSQNAYPLPNGAFAIREQDAKGGYQWKEIGGPTGSSKGSTTPSRATTFEERYADPDVFWKDYKATEADVIERQAREEYAKIKGFDKPSFAEFKNAIPVPTREQVQGEMRSRFDTHRAIVNPPPIDLSGDVAAYIAANGGNGMPTAAQTPQFIASGIAGGFGGTAAGSVAPPPQAIPASEVPPNVPLRKLIPVPINAGSDMYADIVLQTQPAVVHQYLRGKYQSREQVLEAIRTGSDPDDIAILRRLDPSLPSK